MSPREPASASVGDPSPTSNGDLLSVPESERESVPESERESTPESERESTPEDDWESASEADRGSTKERDPATPSRDPPTSVLLPTVKWTSACDEVADQLRPTDELIVICDDATDPVAGRANDLPDGVTLILAGEPTGCSGKANAIAAGMDAASHDRIVWTDDDFHHPAGWLRQLRADYERLGPATEVPFFVGRDPLSTFLEPLYAVGGSLGVYLGAFAWAGGVIFDRDDLDETAFRRDLDRAVSDDGTLSEHLDVTSTRRARRVPAGGTVSESLERHVRFVQIVRYHDPTGFSLAGTLGLLLTAGALLFPLPTLVLVTAFVFGVYATLGVNRWTAMLAFPVVLTQVPLVAYGLGRRTFVWGGRRYRWREAFDVEVVDRDPS